MGLGEVMPVVFGDIRRSLVQTAQISRGFDTRERRNPQDLLLTHPCSLLLVGSLKGKMPWLGVWVSQLGAGGTHWALSVPRGGSVSPAPCRCLGLLLVGSTDASQPQSSPAAPSISWECSLLEKWH